MKAAWVNGQLVDAAAPAVSVLDQGLTVGLGVFETIRVHRGRPVLFDAHIRRMVEGAERIGVTPPAPGTLMQAAEQTIAAAGLVDARLRITLTAGPADGTPTTCVTVGPLPDVAPLARVVTVAWRRNEHSALAGVKSTSYADNVLAQRHARDRGADEVLFGNSAGNVCEGSATNVFVVIEGQLVTPALSSGCLPGVVRAEVVRCGLATEADVALSALGDVTEMFLTSSLRHVQPVSHLDGRALVSGERTRAAARAMDALLDAERTA